MKFGSISVRDAEGTFLAHGVRKGDVVLRKGRVLTREDIAALERADVGTVIACTLDDSDIAEDEAAAKIASAVGGSHVEADGAFTGRVNLRSSLDGVLMLEPRLINALNRIDEAITIATLPDMEAVRKGQMVATVKIIPFAVDRNTLDQVLSLLCGAVLIQVMPFKRLEVSLIQTRLPGIKESVLDKTVSVTSARLKMLGGRLASESRCPHDVQALAGRLRDVEGNLILIAGASAITDRRDVLPAAIEAAGGRIDHFGMPVDPGNLLLLGKLGARPVLGLPGCARSPKLNGFDWVLQRLFAGIEIKSDDIMGMGVGGLLTEIPSRPQPRDREAMERDGPVYGIVLAAGQSTRMGKTNKLLAEVDGKAMVLHAVDAMLGSKADKVLLVTGHEADLVSGVLGDRAVTIVHNPDFALGLSTSLRAALEQVPDHVAGCLIGLGDMPRLSVADLDRLITAFNPGEGRSICVPVVDGKRGNPVLFSMAFAEEMKAIEGDVGARHLLGMHADQVCLIEMDDDAALIDVDTEDALRDLSR